MFVSSVTSPKFAGFPNHVIIIHHARRNNTVFIYFKVIPETYSEMPYVHYLFLFLNFVMWMSLYTASTTDPGFLPGDTKEYKLTLKQVRETKYIYHIILKFATNSRSILLICSPISLYFVLES